MNYNITLKEVYKNLIANSEIEKIYSMIEKREKEDLGYAYHNMNHINNVTSLASYILKSLNYDTNTLYKAKIACLLHDVGALDGKDNHAYRSYIYAKNLFENNNWNFEGKDDILDAIKNHSNSFDSTNFLTLVVMLADKLDIKQNRITDYGMKVIGNRQYGHIIDIIIQIDSMLAINFITDGNIILDEINEYYFTKKVFKAINAFCNKINLDYKVLMDNKIWQVDNEKNNIYRRTT